MIKAFLLNFKRSTPDYYVLRKDIQEVRRLLYTTKVKNNILNITQNEQLN